MVLLVLLFHLTVFGGMMVCTTAQKDNTCSVILHCQDIAYVSGDYYCPEVTYKSSDGPVELSVSYYSDANKPFSAVWSWNNHVISENKHFQIDSTNTSSKLKIKFTINDAFSMEGFYTVTVSNQCGTNSTTTILKYDCPISPIPEISVDPNRIAIATAGDDLKIRTNIRASEMAKIYVCFTSSDDPHNVSMYSFRDYNCVRCSVDFYGSHCLSPLINNTMIYRHQFDVIFSYYYHAVNCSSGYDILFHKNPIGTRDIGNVTFLVDVGSGSFNKTVSLNVRPGKWKKKYVISCLTAIVLATFVSCVFIVCYCSKNKMKKPVYYRRISSSSAPFNIRTAMPRRVSTTSNSINPGTNIGTEYPVPDDKVPELSENGQTAIV